MGVFGRFFRKGDIDDDGYSEASATDEGSSDVEEIDGIQVVRYVLDRAGKPQMIGVSGWHSPVIPDKDSVIWAHDGRALSPYTVMRIDYVESSPDEANHCILVVVRPSSKDEVMRGMVGI